VEGLVCTSFHSKGQQRQALLVVSCRLFIDSGKMWRRLQPVASKNLSEQHLGGMEGGCLSQCNASVGLEYEQEGHYAAFRLE
jgi:hypothetical protein